MGWNGCCVSTPWIASVVARALGHPVQCSLPRTVCVRCFVNLFPASLLCLAAILEFCLPERLFQRKLREKETAMAVMAVCLPTCPAAALRLTEASWSVEELIGLRTVGSRNVCWNFYISASFPRSHTVWWPKIESSDTLHLKLVRCINSFHLSLKHEVLATRFDLQLNGKSYSIFPGPQEW